jgi:3,4-dihydroxy 2-butanone 4-phosphate synthase/GTP cyclohydrolase II
MSFAPTPALLEDIRAGRMVVIVDDEDRENEGDLIMAAQMVRPADINFMVTHARGLVCLSLTEARCRQLNLPPMVQDNRSPYRTNFTVSIEAADGVTTGISAADRARTIQAAVRAEASPQDLTQPGHIFPLMAAPGGVLARAGHTEAAGDLARMAGLEPAGVLVEILDADGGMARRQALERFAQQHGLRIGSIEELIRHRLAHEHTVERVDARDIDTAAGPFRLHTYRDQLSGELHFALVLGAPERDTPTLVRVHVKNPLADVLRWRRPDFGLGVDEALAAVAAAGCGVVVVLSETLPPAQLLARITEQPPVGEARVAEWRRNGAGAQILADLGLGKLRVLGTPRRQVGLAGFGLDVVEYVSPTGVAGPPTTAC